MGFNGWIEWEATVYLLYNAMDIEWLNSMEVTCLCETNEGARFSR